MLRPNEPKSAKGSLPAARGAHFPGRSLEVFSQKTLLAELPGSTYLLAYVWGNFLALGILLDSIGTS